MICGYGGRAINADAQGCLLDASHELELAASELRTGTIQGTR